MVRSMYNKIENRSYSLNPLLRTWAMKFTCIVYNWRQISLEKIDVKAWAYSRDRQRMCSRAGKQLISIDGQLKIVSNVVHMLH